MWCGDNFITMFIWIVVNKNVSVFILIRISGCVLHCLGALCCVHDLFLDMSLFSFHGSFLTSCEGQQMKINLIDLLIYSGFLVDK